MNSTEANALTCDAWNANAAYWDARTGDSSNDFVNQLLDAGFANGFVVDALEERNFTADDGGGNPLWWGGEFHEFPPVLIVRMRLPG